MPPEPKDEFADLPLNLIQRDGKVQFRSTLDGEKIEKLAASIKADGQQNPITVRRMPDGTLVLVSGYRHTPPLMQPGQKGGSKIKKL